jgi:hypothetical protein
MRTDPANASAAMYHAMIERDPDTGDVAIPLEEFEQSVSRIVATPYRWVDPKKVPRRGFLFRKHYIRQFISMTVAPGGMGKTTLSVIDVLSMVCGRNLLTGEKIPGGGLRVWFYQCEDPLDEMQRKVQAACLHYGLTESDIGGRLFMNSGRDVPLVVAREKNGMIFYVPLDIAAVKAEAKNNKIDVMILDPLVATHRVNENDNSAQDEVMQIWKDIATECNMAIEALHHLRKTNGIEATIDDARGAGALVNSVRSARIVCSMSPHDAKMFGIEEERRRFYGWVNPNAKANFAPPSNVREWFEMASVDLGNGDEDSESDKIGVVVPWVPRDAMADVTAGHVDDLRILMSRMDEDALRTQCRVSPLANGWIGQLVGSILEIDVTDGKGKAEVNRVVKAWERSKVLKQDDYKDRKGKIRPFYRLGSSA